MLTVSAQTVLASAVAVPVQRDGRPSRAEYEARIKGALASGDVSALPVMVNALGAAPEELCGDCRGRGIVAGGEEAVNLPEGLGICGCMNPCSLWWDYRRETFAYPHTVKASAVEWVGGRPIAYDYVVCDSCDIEQVSISSGTGLVRMPWRPDCGRCGDTGWLHVGTNANPVFPEDV